MKQGSQQASAYISGNLIPVLLAAIYDSYTNGEFLFLTDNRVCIIYL